MVTIYNAVSADGFVARKDGSEDFIPDEAWTDFLELLHEYDTVVMGRKAYETIQSYPRSMVDAFEKMPIQRFVASRNERFRPKPGYSVTSSITEVSASGKSVLVASGPDLNTAFLRAGLVDRVILNVFPEAVGEGLPVFHDRPKLILKASKELPKGRRLNTYSLGLE